MKTAKLTAILLAAAIILLLAVPTLRHTAWEAYRMSRLSGTQTWPTHEKLESIMQAHSNSPHIWLGLAQSIDARNIRSQYHLRLWEEPPRWTPEQAYQQAIALNPEAPAPYLRYAIYLLADSGELGRKEEGSVEREEAPQRTATQVANLREAESLLKKARGVQPDNAACDYLLAYTYFAQHKDDQAFAVLREAINKPHWNIGSQAAGIAVLRLLDATGSASPLLEMHTSNIVFTSGIHIPGKLRSISFTLTNMGEGFQYSVQHQKAILCYEAVVHLGHVMREDAYTAIDGLTALAITPLVSGPFLSEEERERIMQEVPVTADETHQTEEILAFLTAMDAYGKNPRGREMQKYLRERGKREAVKSAQQRKEEQGFRHQQAERMRRMEQMRLANFAVYMRKQGRADLAKSYPQEVQAAKHWKQQARAVSDSEVTFGDYLWPRYSRLLWLQVGLLLLLWALVGLVSAVARYWREPRAGLAWRWWQGLLLIGVLLTGVRLLGPWKELHIYSWFYPYPIYMRAAIFGLSLIIVAWLLAVLVVTLLKRARQAPTQRLGKARTYLSTLRVLVPVTFAALFLLSVISLWPARQSIKPWRDQTRAEIQQGEVRYWDIGSTNPTKHTPPAPGY